MSGSVYVVNQDGFVTPMKYQENNLKGLVWSMSEDRDEKITSHDLIGFGNSTIYIWDPVCAGDAMEMSFQQGFDSEALISSLDASNMSLPSKFYVFIVISTDTCFVLRGLISVARKNPQTRWL